MKMRAFLLQQYNNKHSIEHFHNIPFQGDENALSFMIKKMNKMF